MGGIPLLVRRHLDIETVTPYVSKTDVRMAEKGLLET